MDDVFLKCVVVIKDVFFDIVMLMDFYNVVLVVDVFYGNDVWFYFFFRCEFIDIYYKLIIRVFIDWCGLILFSEIYEYI